MKFGHGIPSHDACPASFKALDRQCVNRTRQRPSANLAGWLRCGLESNLRAGSAAILQGRDKAFAAVFAIKVCLAFGLVRVDDGSNGILPMPPPAA